MVLSIWCEPKALDIDDNNDEQHQNDDIIEISNEITEKPWYDNDNDNGNNKETEEKKTEYDNNN
eukprot:CAMPEP_0201580300 /NCGR_PEP_ID=MMETSP0190_2-20130828/42157_1 /ASSEMBLY_ACC=CAM_ASM_000263 /TAXON_ID=37353 /ORGANISM="Rosalina sp." /LENGTH=63 /DNA_ID=CAMNT_0048016079 /DNA_START=88 /DNA_END=276 /DNA_ORIENTATION=+